MRPREHGAYGQVLLPLGTMLAIGPRGVVAIALAAVAICAFLAHEPVLVLLGARGSRLAREQRGQAWRVVASLGILALAIGVPAVYLAPPAARAALLVSAGLAGLLFALIVAGRERSIPGELLSALILASFALPVGLGSGAAAGTALTCAVVYGLVFCTATLGVHAVIGCERQPPAAAMRATAIVAALCALAVLGWLASRGTLAPVAPWAGAPGCISAAALAIRPPRARHLRAVGWLLVAATTATALVLVAALR